MEVLPKRERGGKASDLFRTSPSGVMEIVVIDISGWIVSGGNLEMGTEHIMDVQITCYGCP